MVRSLENDIETADGIAKHTLSLRSRTPATGTSAAGAGLDHAVLDERVYWRFKDEK